MAIRSAASCAHKEDTTQRLLSNKLQLTLDVLGHSGRYTDKKTSALASECKDKKTSALALECKTTVSIVRYPCSPLKIYCFFHTPLRLVPHPDETLLCLDKKLHTCVASISTRSTYTVPRLVHLGPKEMHLDSADLLCALLVQLDVKLLLQSHHDLHSVERVSSQVHEL